MTLQTIDVLSDLEELLVLVAEKIQLPDSLDSKARDRYKTLTTLLQASPLGYYSVEVYAQGSYRIGTTNKPITGEEYDLDFVVEVVVPIVPEPQALLDAVWQVLAQSGIYAGMLERRQACIRIHYADEFHVDIVPAISDESRGGTAILIPRSVNPAFTEWHGTNPKAFANWFIDVRSRRMLSKEMKIEQLPPAISVRQKSPLQVTVQLYKRHHYLAIDDEHLRTASIVLTTITGQNAGDLETVGETLGALVESLAEFDQIADAPVITNPGAAHEVLTDKWLNDGRIYAAFRENAKRFRQDWRELLSLQKVNYPALVNKLAQMFGEEPTHAAVKQMSNRRQSARTAGILATTSGGVLKIDPAARGNRQHTFYGGSTS